MVVYVYMYDDMMSNKNFKRVVLNTADRLGLHLYNLNVNKIKLMKITSKIKKKDSEVSANNNRKEEVNGFWMVESPFAVI